MRTCEPTPFVNVYQKEIEMRLTSRSIEEGSRMPAAQSYAGGNRSPELSWRDPPEGTRSFAVTCFDPDAPTGSGWWHWCVLNLPAALRSLPEGASPENLEALGAITLRIVVPADESRLTGAAQKLLAHLRLAAKTPVERSLPGTLQSGS